MKKIFKIILPVSLTLIFIIGYFFVGKARPAEKITWGVNFSQKQTELLKLNWQETYLALLDDLKVKNIKLLTHWDLIEPREGIYNFEDLDWQIKTAEEKDVRLLLVVGMKTGRWPECHEPGWVKNQNSKIKSQNYLLEYLKEIVNRYKNNEAIWAWQVENEPFFPFGECPKIDKDFLKEEVKLVKLLDTQKRPIIISDSGEFSFWIKAGQIGDIVGTTMYKKTWFEELKTYVRYPLPAIFYWRKAQIIKKLFNKDVIVVELQAEPWLAGPEKTMNLKQLKKNIEFAKKTGLKEFYLWGAEWWHWLKEKQNQPEIWNEAKKLWFSN